MIVVSEAPGKEKIPAASDADRFCEEILVRRLGFERDNIFFLTDETGNGKGERFPRKSATRSNVERTLEEVAERTAPGDFVLTYVVAHGEKNAEGKLVIRLQDESYLIEELLAQLTMAAPQLKLVVLDCCFSGRVSLTGLADQARERTRDKRADVEKLYPPIVLTSASASERSWFEGDSGIFQRSLLSAFENVDEVRGELLTPDEIHRRVRRELEKRVRSLSREIVQEPLLLFTESMRDVPLFLSGEAELGRLKLVGDGLERAAIEINGSEVRPGLHGRYLRQLLPDNGEYGASHQLVVRGFLPRWDNEIHVKVETEDGRDFEIAFRSTETIPEKIVRLPAGPAAESPSDPQIQIAGISQRKGLITGRVFGVPTESYKDYEVVVFIKTDCYYPHPYMGKRVPVEDGGDWQVEHVPRGAEQRIAALLIPRGETLPALEPQGRVENLGAVTPRAKAYDDLPYRSEYEMTSPSEKDG
ncbi:MAG: caspase family protein [Planctomycetota bacterium]